MKHLYTLCLSILVLALPLAVSAQTPGKPLYRIHVERDGAPLGDIMIEMFPEVAPEHVRNFDSLVSIGFYDGTAFHRVIPGFMIQGGDPNSRDKPRNTWGFGDPSQQTVPAEFSNLSHVRGIISAARSDDPNSATSQFFICHGSPTFLDHNYSIYGRATSGMDVVDTIVNAPRDASDNPILKHTMTIERTGIDTSIPAMPSLLLPVDGVRNVGATATLSWDSVPGAILYYLQFSSNPYFTTIDTTLSTVATSLIARGLKTGRNTYYWRVIATNGGRRSAPSAVRSLITSIATPKLAEPATGTIIPGTSTVLRWNRVDAATSYRVQLSTRITYNPLIVDEAGVVDTFLTVEGLAPDTKYYWRVRAYDDTAAGPVSGNAIFTVSGPSSVELSIPLPAAPELIMGAPGSGAATFQVALESGTDVSVVVTDIAGRDLRQIHSGWLAPGIHRFPIDLSELPAGTYLVRLEQGGRSVARTFQIAR